MADIDKLEAIARAATPGPWTKREDEENEAVICLPAGYIECGGARVRREANAEHIATFSPERVLALLAVVRAARGADNTMKSMRAEYTPLRTALAALDALEDQCSSQR